MFGEKGTARRVAHHCQAHVDPERAPHENGLWETSKLTEDRLESLLVGVKVGGALLGGRQTKLSELRVDP